jgi:hypothetical protein
MHLAYIISAYKYPEQLTRLVLRLNADTSAFFIHVDQKAEQQIYDQITANLASLPNVHFLSRHRCDWGGFGHVRATLKGINELFKRGIPFDYAILLTGQDYPIKSNDQIHDFLQNHAGTSFMDYFELPCHQWENQGLDRIERWHLHVRNRQFSLPPVHRFPLKRRFVQGLKPFGGSSYWCLTRDCVEYIDQFTKRDPSFVKFFERVDVPDELFFQTILMNSPFRADIANDDLRYIEWPNPDFGSPIILSQRDYAALAQSPKLFARKFDVMVDAAILDLIDQNLLLDHT